MSLTKNGTSRLYTLCSIQKRLYLATVSISQYAMFFPSMLLAWQDVCALNYNPQPLRHSWTSTRANNDYAFIVFLMSCGAKSRARAILSHAFSPPPHLKITNSRFFRWHQCWECFLRIFCSRASLKSNLGENWLRKTSGSDLVVSKAHSTLSISSDWETDLVVALNFINLSYGYSYLLIWIISQNIMWNPTECSVLVAEWTLKADGTCGCRWWRTYFQKAF